MMAYKMTMFMVFFNLAMGITTTVISPLIFPDRSVVIQEKDTSYLNSSLSIFNTILPSGDVNSGIGKVLELAVTGGLLALFAFSLLIPTIPLVALFFSYNAILTFYYLDMLHIPDAFSIPLKMGVVIVSFIGISQYMARSTVQGA